MFIPISLIPRLMTFTHVRSFCAYIIGYAHNAVGPTLARLISYGAIRSVTESKGTSVHFDTGVQTE